MRFYMAKGLQLAGFLGVGWGLWTGMTGRASLVAELAAAAFGCALFYLGRSIEP